MEILITAGGTEEPIDGVRTISNFSTGLTGAIIADIFYKKGFKVTLLTSRRAVSPKKDVEIIRYQSFKDLNNSLKELLGSRKYSGVIHAAAVSDYSVDYLESEGIKFEPLPDSKIDSKKALTIHLKPNFKIISMIKSYSINPLILIGFKLTKNATDSVIQNKLNAILEDKTIDYVVQNDLTSIDKKRHLSNIYKREKLYKQCKTKVELALGLVKIFKEK